MIIKKIVITNFRSYYGENTFELSKGLTLIIGGNGDGKTTFFEALEWLLNTSLEIKELSNVSEMRKSELSIGEVDTMSVSMLFEHNGEKEVTKSLTFEKMSDGNCKVTNYSFRGYETDGAERMLRTGKSLIDSCFDSYIRRYCLFKGESQLNVFNEPTALKTLVDKFSDIRKFEDFVEVASDLEQKSETAYTKECKSDTKVAKRVGELQRRKEELEGKISELRRDIKKQEEVASTYQLKLDDLEKHQATSERYQEIKDRLKTKNEKLSRLKSLILVNYNAGLLDNFWILSPYTQIFKEFQKKVSALSKEKRLQNDQDIATKAAAKAKKEVVDEIASFANGKSKLPWYLPDEQTMREMLDDEICKVCGRPALRGTEEYKFMEGKLHEYIRHMQEEADIKAKELEEKPLFEGRAIEDLHAMSISFGGTTAMEIAKKYQEVKDLIEFVDDRKKDIAIVEAEIQEIEDEKSRLLIQADGISEDMLDKNFNDIKGYFEQRNRAEQRISDYKAEMKDYQNDLERVRQEFDSLDPSSGMAKVYGKVHTLLDKVMKAFINAKKENLRRFLASLSEKTNEYFKLLNENDFRGEIRIRQTANDSAEIRLFSSNGTYIKDPGGAQETTMYMSLLFAISDLTTLKKEEDYPLIFDAPTSSFEDFKENVFYNIIDKIDKQCIIVTKDLLEVDKKTGHKTLNTEKIESMTCSVYRIEKKAGYDQEDLSTIRTIITPIK
ncbi:AAA family ATPase [Barnesiella intestinihominis]|jgi:DNA sulfur modification protein DndD|uniref:AAA family ATPase n=1 Tax=Barnesiella intestinihominis TaxID=487174 RepID=UPI0015B6E6F6|nr:AAA family ATPase [Barnesiella intestinihominis]